MAFHGKKCAACGEVILGEAALEYNPGEYYHKKCFVCNKCKKPLSGDVFEASDGTKICGDCIPKRKCEACGKEIVGPCRNLNGKTYHPDCLVCVSCKEPLKGAIFEVNGGLTCEPCAKGEKKPAPAAPEPAAAPAPKAAPEPEKKPEKKEPEKAMEVTKSIPANALSGHIYKKKGRRGFRGWDWRYFCIADMHVAWWKNEAEAKLDNEAPDGKHCKGCIDLLYHPCKVKLEGSHATRFKIEAEGSWRAGDQHWEADRVFMFDAHRSDHSREVWVSCISSHIQKSASCRANPPRKGCSFVAPEEVDEFQESKKDVKPAPFTPPARQEEPKPAPAAAPAPAPTPAPVAEPTPAPAPKPEPVPEPTPPPAPAAEVSKPAPAPEPEPAPKAAPPPKEEPPPPAPEPEPAPAPTPEAPVVTKAMPIPEAAAPTGQTSTVSLQPLNQHVVDKIITAIDNNLVKLKAAASPSAVSAVKAEMNILSQLDKARDNMMKSIQDTDDKDRKKLLDTWGGDCNRIARMRAMLEALDLSEKHKNDKRKGDCLTQVDIIERLLRERKLAKQLEEAQEECMPWRPPAERKKSKEEEPEKVAAKPKAAAPAPAPEPEPAPKAAPKKEEPAPAPAGAASAQPKKKAGATEVENKNVLLSAGEAFSDDEEEPIHMINVEATGNMGPDVEFGPKGTFILEMPSVSVAVNTEITPPLPPLKGETQIPPYQEVILDTPELNGFIFDPAKKNGKHTISVQGRVPVVHVGGAYESKANLVCQSPWGSMKLREGKEDTEMHWTVDVRGRLGAEQTSFSNLLYADVVLNITIQLSGPGSKSFSKDGKEMPLPDYAALSQ